MTDSPNLAMPFVDGGDPLAEVTLNEALRVIDTLVQLAIVDRDLNTPPGSPAEGQRWIVEASPSPTGAWAGHGNHVAAWQDGGWIFSVPKTGWLAYLIDEGALVAWSGTAWADALDVMGGITTLQNLTLLGIGTTADSTNPLSAKLNNTLFAAKTVAEGGDGNLRYKLSKEAASNTLSFLFQDNFSGRAEIGLTGDDDFHFKVSSDGSTWIEALVVDRSTGGVRFRAAESNGASAATCDIGAAASLKVAITGTTTITSFGTAAHALRIIKFAGALTLTHNATTLVLPGAANITTAANDRAVAGSDGSGNWYVVAYQRASGKPVVGPAAADVSDSTATGRALLTAADAPTARAAIGAPAAVDMRSYLAGLGMSNNGGAPNTKIDVAAGVARDDTNAVTISFASTKTIDCGTTGANGLDTGSLANNTWYHTFAIAKADGTVASFASTSLTPTLPTGYAYKRRIGSFKTDGSAHIVGFVQRGDTFNWKAPVSDAAAVSNPGTSAVLVSLTIPSGIKCDARFGFLFSPTNASTDYSDWIYFSDPDLPDTAPGGAAFSTQGFSQYAGALSVGGEFQVTTDTSCRIRMRWGHSTAGGAYYISTHGWIDRRGKDD